MELIYVSGALEQVPFTYTIQKYYCLVLSYEQKQKHSNQYEISNQWQVAITTCEVNNREAGDNSTKWFRKPRTRSTKYRFLTILNISQLLPTLHHNNTWTKRFAILENKTLVFRRLFETVSLAATLLYVRYTIWQTCCVWLWYHIGLK